MLLDRRNEGEGRAHMPFRARRPIRLGGFGLIAISLECGSIVFVERGLLSGSWQRQQQQHIWYKYRNSMQEALFFSLSCVQVGRYLGCARLCFGQLPAPCSSRETKVACLYLLCPRHPSSNGLETKRNERAQRALFPPSRKYLPPSSRQSVCSRVVESS